MKGGWSTLARIEMDCEKFHVKSTLPINCSSNNDAVINKFNHVPHQSFNPVVQCLKVCRAVLGLVVPELCARQFFASLERQRQNITNDIVRNA